MPQPDQLVIQVMETNRSEYMKVMVQPMAELFMKVPEVDVITELNPGRKVTFNMMGK